MAAGHDPISNRDAKALEKRAEEARAITFKECALAYIEGQRAGWTNKKSPKQWRATLERYAFPTLGNICPEAVDVGLVHKVLDPIWAVKPETAGRLRGRLEAILDWAKTRGYRTGENPARWKGHLQNLFPARSRLRQEKHFAALPYDEVGAFISAVQGQSGLAATVLQFTILTAVRTGDVLGAAWEEIDLTTGIWTIPAERTKARRTHRVPLSDPALTIIRTQHAATGGIGLVFPGKKRGKGLSNMAMLVLLKRMKRGDLTVHGFRSCFRDWVAEQTSFPNEVAEMALAHAVSDKVEAAYRRGDLFEKRRKLMNAWAAFCSAPSHGGKVVNIRAATGQR